MNLKTLLFITLFLYAVVLSQQATLDLEEARIAERKAVQELKHQADVVKQEFKVTFKKLKGKTLSTPDDTSDSDSLLQKAITAADNAADSEKANEIRGVTEMKSKAQRAKEAYRAAKANLKAKVSNAVDQVISAEQSALEGLKNQARNAKEQFKAAFNRLKGTRTAAPEEGSDRDTIIEKAITEADNAADTTKASEWRAVSELKSRAQQTKEAYKSAKAAIVAKATSAADQIKSAEHSGVEELKTQARNAKEQFKAAFRKIKGTSGDAASDSSDSDTVIQKAISVAETAADTATAGEWRALVELKNRVQQARNAYKTAKANLKAKFSKNSASSESSDSSSDSSDSDDGSLVDKAKWAGEWKAITELKDQANRARQAAKDAYAKLRGLEGGESSDSSSDSSDSLIEKAAKIKAAEMVVEKVEEKVTGETIGLLEQARNAQRLAYNELKDGARRAKDAFKTAYRDLKNRIRAEKVEDHKPVDTEL